MILNLAAFFSLSAIFNLAAIVVPFGLDKIYLVAIMHLVVSFYLTAILYLPIHTTKSYYKIQKNSLQKSTFKIEIQTKWEKSSALFLVTLICQFLVAVLTQFKIPILGPVWPMEYKIFNEIRGLGFSSSRQNNINQSIWTLSTVRPCNFRASSSKWLF